MCSVCVCVHECVYVVYVCVCDVCVCRYVTRNGVQSPARARQGLFRLATPKPSNYLLVQVQKALLSAEPHPHPVILNDAHMLKANNSPAEFSALVAKSWASTAWEVWARGSHPQPCGCGCPFGASDEENDMKWQLSRYHSLVRSDKLLHLPGACSSLTPGHGSAVHASQLLLRL